MSNSELKLPEYVETITTSSNDVEESHVDQVVGEDTISMDIEQSEQTQDIVHHSDEYKHVDHENRLTTSTNENAPIEHCRTCYVSNKVPSESDSKIKSHLVEVEIHPNSRTGLGYQNLQETKIDHEDRIEKCVDSFESEDLIHCVNSKVSADSSRIPDTKDANGVESNLKPTDSLETKNATSKSDNPTSPFDTLVKSQSARKSFTLNSSAGFYNMAKTDNTSNWEPHCFTVFSILNFLLYVATIGSDIAVCYCLYVEGYTLYFWIAVSFTIGASLLLNATSLCLSFYTISVKCSVWNSYQPIGMSLVIFLVHVLQGGMLLRYVSRIVKYEMENIWLLFFPRWFYSDKNIHSGSYFDTMGLPYLLVLEAMGHCCPQLILQLNILMNEHKYLDYSTNYVVTTSIVLSLFNLTRLLTHTKHCSKHFSTPVPGLAMMYLWHLFMNISRMAALTFLASRFLHAFLIFVICHWLIMSFFSCKTRIRREDSDGFTTSKIQCVLKSLFCGILYFLCFMRLDPLDEVKGQSETRCIYLFYYVVIFVENSVMVGMWCAFSGLDIWLRVAGLSTTLAAFALGIITMLLYYRLLHRNIRKSDVKWAHFLVFPTKV